VQVTASVAIDDGHAVVRIADDGPGIDPAVANDLFERFSRADSSRARQTGGTGLGLSIAKAIVTAHGGTISVDSAPGSTVFTVRLPARPATPPPTDPPRAKVARTPGSAASNPRTRHLSRDAAEEVAQTRVDRSETSVCVTVITARNASSTGGVFAGSSTDGGSRVPARLGRAMVVACLSLPDHCPRTSARSSPSPPHAPPATPGAAWKRGISSAPSTACVVDARRTKPWDAEEPLARDRAHRSRVLRDARAYAQVAPSHAFLAGRSAAVAWGLPCDSGRSCASGSRAAPRARRPGIHGVKVAPHLATVRELEAPRDEPRDDMGDARRVLDERELVILGDAIVRIPRDERGTPQPMRRLATIDRLRAAAGARQARAPKLLRALERVRVGNVAARDRLPTRDDGRRPARA
jgi:hypothetical protein